jgi:signal transduction histidine kinase
MTSSGTGPLLLRRGRELGFLISPLVLAPLWFAALIAVWTVTVCVAITPLVVPALVGVALTVRGGAIAEAWLCGGLLRARPQLPAWDWGQGFWRRGWEVLSDSWLWRAQAYLVLRVTLGFAVALMLVALLAAGLFLLTLPVFYWSVPEGAELGVYRVHTLAQALPGVPAGLLVLALTAGIVGPLARPWRRISVTLLEEMPSPAESSPGQVPGTRGLIIHALVFAGLNLLLVVVWLLTSRGYFWPVWTLLVLAVPLAIHAWVIFATQVRASLWPRYRLDTDFAVHAGIWVIMLLFLTGVWAAAGGGYFWPVWIMLAGVLATGAHAAALRLSGGPDTAALTERISTLESSRAGAVDVQEAELRRIERDLHDGAQARLVALGMSLGMAEQKLATDTDAARELLADARADAGEALRELRDLARGIHPPVLADRGLDAAVRALAAASPLSVSVSTTLPERPKAPVESAAYFVVAEGLANAGKHSGARKVDVSIARNGDLLSVEISDDGSGGADPAGGGLSGLRRRVEALDGRLLVISPPGGPTTIRAELPCVS